MFVVLTSKEWYVSEFTEIYCIAILSFAIYLKEKMISKLNMIAILLSLNSSLIKDQYYLYCLFYGGFSLRVLNKKTIKILKIF